MGCSNAIFKRKNIVHNDAHFCQSVFQGVNKIIRYRSASDPDREVTFFPIYTGRSQSSCSRCRRMWTSRRCGTSTPRRRGSCGTTRPGPSRRDIPITPLPGGGLVGASSQPAPSPQRPRQGRCQEAHLGPVLFSSGSLFPH